VGHVPNFNPGEFLFLSGFTYFMGVWMDFERTARRLVSQPGDRPIVGGRLLELLRQKSFVEEGAELLIHRLNSELQRTDQFNI
jgi:hypothetical protein